jgi:hypothetical protein
VADFSGAKIVRQDTTFTMQSATFSPQKHHHKPRFFLKTPCKNAELARRKKSAKRNQKNPTARG